MTGDVGSVLDEAYAAARWRTAASSWPVTHQRLVAGRPIQLTRRGQLIFAQYRKQQGRAVDVTFLLWELVSRGVITTMPDSQSPSAAMSIQQFAELAGVNRGTVTGQLEIVPAGAPVLVAAGKIPARQIGRTRRIFLQDLLGSATRKEATCDCHRQKETPNPTRRAGWRGQIDHLFDRRHR